MGTNTGIGNANAIGFKSRVTGGIYFPPELKDALVGVWSAYGKSNDSTDRNIIKNKIKDRGGDFVISNATFKLNSGFGKYEITFQYFPYRENVTNVSDSKVVFGIGGQLLIPYPAITENIPSFKIKVNGLSGTYHFRYYYRSSDGVQHSVDMAQDGYYELPICYNVQSSSDGTNCGFANNGNDVVTITQIPSFEGAFVTDGIDDLITSTKTVREMLGGSTEFTAVSMIHLISPGQDVDGAAYTNYIRTSDNYWTSNRVSNVGKTGIYGYSFKQSTPTVINNILGDKGDYTTDKSPDTSEMFRANFSVEGFEHAISGTVHASSVAWYWTIIANKVLTTDQINQVIAYFNLDRTLKPDILCDVKKQGITNENHAEFGDKLIDFSGNGRDIQLNNIAWKGDSGIGKYETELSNTSIWTQSKETTSSPFSSSYNGLSGWIIFANTKLTNSVDMPSFKIQVKGLLEGQELIYRYYDSNGQSNVYSITKDGDYTLPSDFRTAKPQISNTSGFQVVKNEANIITITQIPSHAGGLCLDGINDFGKVTGMPIYKDYTFISKYQRLQYREAIETTGGAVVASKSYSPNQGAFIFNGVTGSYRHDCYSFGLSNNNSLIDDRNLGIYYQTKYTNQGKNISIGNGVDSDILWLGIVRDNDSRFLNGVIYYLMSFPYSMSEFLIERQLKKHKLGTLYPDMVEFRPVIKSNASYDNIVFYYKNEKVENGTYLTVGSSIGMHICLSSNSVNEIKSITINGIPATFKFHDANNNIYQYDFNLTSKSPQKINITIDEYIRYEDIVQPYPSLFTLIDYDTEEVYSWGSKLKVGARFKGNVVNLLPNMYEWQGNVLYNGEVLDWGIKPGVVAKEMVFSWNMPFKYLIDNNEPKVILSPRLLRIPNSSYKILGYIPDISGHGNHGKINNSAYAEGSGVNEDGSYQFDGVDDFVTIPSTVGGKQVLMKTNWLKSPTLLYDQRASGSFAILITNEDDETNPRIAYQARNLDGKTYIDGIENNYIETYSLKGITHNITIANSSSGGVIVPVIGCNTGTTSSFAQMSLYDFMLFDEISTDDKIKELNEYVGIEAKVELPPYYWDAYGKTNLDADKATIQQRGVAVGDYDLTNYNHVYEGMSGYNGYPVVFGANKTWEILSSVYSYISDVTSTTIHVTMVKNAGTGLLFSYVKKDEALTNIKEIPAFRVTIKGLEGNSKFGYRYLATEDATGETLVYLGNGTHELAKSFTPTEALLNLTRNAWVGIFITPMVEGEVVFDCDITIEVLPEYENGLAYDGIIDYSKNANIPVLTDYTYIYKRTIINIPTNAATLLKGADKTNGGAFIADYGNKWQFNFGQYNTIQGIADGINWQTVNSFNGTSINKGKNTDDSGITVAKFSNGYTSMVFYKLILYPKTISLLEINFLKNLMERDEIIDLNNPIFIKNE